MASFVSSDRPGAVPDQGPRRVRDLLILPRGDELIVVAADSAGGVGPKQGDSVRVTARTVGKFTARVALMEVLASGARPLAVALCSCNEPHPVAAEVMQGVLEEMACVGLPPETLVMSTEKNFPTVQTGVGVTAFGAVRSADFRPGRARPGDRVVVVGRPKVGAEVNPDDEELADLRAVLFAAALPGVSDLLPVGSTGVAAEARVLAALAGLKFVPSYPEGLDPRSSAGPATALLVCARPEAVEELSRGLAPKPCSDVGCLVRPAGPGSPGGREDTGRGDRGNRRLPSHGGGPAC